MRGHKQQSKSWSANETQGLPDSSDQSRPVPELTFILVPKCPICKEPMPEGNSRKSACPSCWESMGDGRSRRRDPNFTTTTCTKCRADLDPAEPSYRRCRRCREDVLRLQRRRGVSPKNGQDELCPQCQQPMIDNRYPSCEECRLGPKLSKRTRRRDIAGRFDPLNISSSSPNSLASYHGQLPSPASSSYIDTPSTSSRGSLQLTPLSMEYPLSSDSPYTSYVNTPYSPQPNLPPVAPQYATTSQGVSPISPSRGIAPHTSPLYFSTPLASVPLPDEPNFHPSNAVVPRTRLQQSPIGGYGDSEQPMLLRTSDQHENALQQGTNYILPAVTDGEDETGQEIGVSQLESFVNFLNSDFLPDA